MLIKSFQYTVLGSQNVSLRCPGCGNRGTFTPFFPQNAQMAQDVVASENNQPRYLLGQRKCPNPDCGTHVFVVCSQQGKVLDSYPVQRVEFDSSHIPDRIVQSFNEALSCFASDLYVAAAIMIRRTLEELCADKEAKGDNLKAKISSLKNTVIMPEKLFGALDDLRLLGNDAAHIESKTFDDVGKEEIDVAVEFTKEILKAVYQYDDLVSRIRALKKQPTAPPI